ncbi:hypothetical protein B0O80DRAFT_486981 [Mortierella sp. GBAus27b]|nr:hypothetical protein B0O80DRAFT_486981 [Mortierella sp. GBAus27b]
MTTGTIETTLLLSAVCSGGSPCLSSSVQFPCSGMLPHRRRQLSAGPPSQGDLWSSTVHQLIHGPLVLDTRSFGQVIPIVVFPYPHVPLLWFQVLTSPHVWVWLL